MPAFLWTLLTSAITAALTWLALHLGITPNNGDLQSTATWMALGVAAAVGFIVDHYFPQIAAWFKSNGPKSSGLPAIFLMVAAGLMFCATSGCSLFAQPTPMTATDLAIQQVTQAEEAYLLITTPVDVAIATGGIKGTAAIAINTAEEIATSYLNAARTAAYAGKTVDSQAQLALFAGAKADVVAAITKAKGAATAPATATSQPGQ